MFIPITRALDITPLAIGVTIVVAASSPILTPFGLGTYTPVVWPVKLNFMDFFKPGLGMTVVVTIVSMIFIPFFWPL